MPRNINIVVSNDSPFPPQSDQAHPSLGTEVAAIAVQSRATAVGSADNDNLRAPALTHDDNSGQAVNQNHSKDLHDCDTVPFGTSANVGGLPINIPDFQAFFTPQHLKRLIQTHVRIVETSDISVCRNGKSLVNEIEHVVAADARGNYINVDGVRGNAPVSIVQQAAQSGREIELVGTLELDGDNKYQLAFQSARPLTTPLMALGVTSEEINSSREIVACRRADLFSYIFAKMISTLGVKGIDELPQLRKALVAVLLQAASYGRLFNASGRLNVLLIGAPGVGKGMCAKAANILCLCERVPTSSISLPGLVGSYRRTPTGTSRIIPGVLARANDQTAIFEDLQNLDGGLAKAVFGALCDAMEYGEISRTLVTPISFQIETALYFDINPRSSLRPQDGKVLFIDDIGLPLNFLSRTDIIIEIASNFERQLGTSVEMINSVTASAASDEKHAAIRHLRVLLAYLKNEFASISFDGVMTSVNTKLNELLQANAQSLDRLHLSADFVLRGSRAILKMIAASARLHARSVATEEDVAIAFELFAEKLEFIKKLEPAFRPVDSWKGDATSKALRQQRIREHFAGRIVSLEQLVAMFSKVTTRTLRRDMEEIDAKLVGKSTWEVVGATIPAQQ